VLRRLAFALLLGACSRDAGAAGDQAALRALVDADTEVAELLHAADGLVVAGRAKDAAVLLDGPAREKADRNVKVATSLAPASAWGKSRADDVRGVVTDRRAAIDAYRGAIAKDDIAGMIDVLKAQQELEARALRASSRANEPPPSGC
jgi:hypothetical protein